MQVNNCTEPKPSFGMALKISKKPEAVKTLKSMTDAELKELANAGRELKGTKKYNLELNDKGERLITSEYGGAYKDIKLLKPEYPFGETMFFNAKWMGEEHDGLIKGHTYTNSVTFENAKAAENAYKDVMSASTGIGRDAKMVKILDADAIAKEKAAKAAEEKAAAEAAQKAAAKESAIQNLLKHFGI